MKRRDLLALGLASFAASGLTPIIATALLQSYGPNGGWAIAAYCVFAGIVSALSALWISVLARRRSSLESLVPATAA